MKSRNLGLSLIELLVALAIGSIMIAGAVYVYMQSRTSYTTSDTVARLQETARYALSVIEPDVRMSSYWGLLNDAELVTGRTLQSAGVNSVAPGSTGTQCGNNFAVDLFNNIEGTDNTYSLTCAASGGGARANTDTLTVRRASAIATTLPLTAGGRLRLWSSRSSGTLFNDTTLPGAAPPDGQVNDIVVNSYYVSQNSDTNRVGIPALRRKSLVDGAFLDNEIISGVEDIQVQFGIDATGTTKTVTRYINPLTAAGMTAAWPSAQVVAVRIWVLVRAETAEVGFTDNKTYTYGNRVYTPNDGFRRVLTMRTIHVRNTLGL